MGGLFGSSKSKVPKPQPPGAVPVTGVGDEDWAMRLARRGKGFEKTILTGNLVPSTTKKTRLG